MPQIPVHIVLYGFLRRACFFTEDDFRLYLYQLASVLNRYNVSMHAYVLMPNHVHLLLTQNDKYGIDEVVRSQSNHYQNFIRRTYKTNHPVWQKNYKACHINPDEYLIKMYQYIELNPVRAGLVDLAQEYIWSSFSFHAMNEKNSLLKEHNIFQSISNNKLYRHKQYFQLCENGLSKYDLINIQSAIQNEVAMGDKSFNDHIQMSLLRDKQINTEDDVMTYQKYRC